MELKFSGQFRRDIANRNKALSEEIRNTIKNAKEAQSLSQIQHLVKLKKYEVHYRIRVTENYRIGIIVRGNTVWFSRFGHRNLFYKKLFP